MQLVNDPPKLRSHRGRVFRSSPLGDGIAALVSLGVLAGGAFALARLVGELPWFLWLAVGPMALLTGFVMLLIAGGLCSAFAASLRETNWSAFVQHDGVFLNLRSYRNGHFGGRALTVLFLPFSEVTSVRAVTERSERTGHRGGTVSKRVKWVELCVQGDTEELAEACRLERERPAPTTSFLGISSSTKHHNVPLFIPAPGVIQVAWDKALLDCLAQNVERESDREQDLTAALAGLSPIERAGELVKRGERIHARRILVGELGWDEDKAKRFLEGKRAA